MTKLVALDRPIPNLKAKGSAEESRVYSIIPRTG